MRTLLLAVCSAALAIAASSNRYKEDFHSSYPQSAGGRLSLENFNGSVEVTGWDQNTVDISGTKYAETPELLQAVRIEASSSGNGVDVRTSRPDHRRGNAGATYVIRVPRRTELQSIHSSNGSIRISDIEGIAVLKTSNGSVHLSRIRGRVDAASSNGGIDVNGVDGSMALHTSNGGVRGQDVRGALDARTSNGSIRFRLRETEPGQPIKAATSNGGIELDVEHPRNNDVIASTTNGGITVRVPEITNATVSAHTSSHDSIHSDFGIMTRGELSKHHIEGTIGGGGPKLELTTSNGNIRLLKL